MMSQTYFIVWCENGAQPTYKHSTYISAKREAERLARVHIGKRFAVLVAISAHLKTDVTTVRYDFDQRDVMDEEIPF